MRPWLAGRLLPVDEVLDQRFAVHRPGEQESLTEIAAEIAKRGDLLGELDSFRDDVETQAGSERDDGGDQPRLLVLGRKERAIHLEDVDGKAAQVGERRVARPEVVHREE